MKKFLSVLIICIICSMGFAIAASGSGGDGVVTMPTITIPKPTASTTESASGDTSESSSDSSSESSSESSSSENNSSESSSSQLPTENTDYVVTDIPFATAIAECAVTGIGNAVYTGEAITPLPTITFENSVLQKDVDYTLSYRNNTSVGTATVTICGKGNYTGKMKRTFAIHPAGTSLARLLSPQSGAVYAEWTVQNVQVTGYQLEYSLSQDFENGTMVAVKGADESTAQLEGLQGGNTYYVRIRTYKTVGNGVYYSDWSGAETVTVNI